MVTNPKAKVVLFDPGNYHTPDQRWVCWRIITSSLWARELSPLWAVEELTEDGQKVVLCQGRKLDTAHGFPANAEVREIAGPRQTEHSEVNR